MSPPEELLAPGQQEQHPRHIEQEVGEQPDDGQQYALQPVAQGQGGQEGPGGHAVPERRAHTGHQPQIGSGEHGQYEHPAHPLPEDIRKKGIAVHCHIFHMIERGFVEQPRLPQQNALSYVHHHDSDQQPHAETDQEIALECLSSISGQEPPPSKLHPPHRPSKVAASHGMSLMSNAHPWNALLPSYAGRLSSMRKKTPVRAAGRGVSSICFNKIRSFTRPACR